MNYQEILEKVKLIFSGGLPKNFKIYNYKLSLDNTDWIFNLVEWIKKSNVR